jgi:hypothetical protein
MPLKYIVIPATAGNVDTDILVPDNKTYEFLWGQVILTTDATSANRWVRIATLDLDGNNALCLCAGKTVPASQTDQLHNYIQGIFRETSFINNVIQVPVAKNHLLPPGFTLRSFIENGVAGDSYSGGIMVMER